MFDPPDQSTWRILGEGEASLILLNGCVGMGNGGGWDEDCGASRELNHQFELPKNHVPTFRVVKGAKGGDRAHAEGNIGEIAVFRCHCRRPEVECDGGPDTVMEVPSEVGIPGEKWIEAGLVVVVEFWNPCCKRA